MTGGTDMYIHSYQIHNVLNEYRKQLSRGPTDKGKLQKATAAPKDRVIISDNGQRQSIIDQVSAEIVERIKHANIQKADKDLVEGKRDFSDRDRADFAKKETEFTYTLIDEFNRKVTNSLPIQDLNPLAGQNAPVSQEMAKIHSNLNDSHKSILVVT
jgi:hypothetical protein